jgi:hypothetical protein
MHGRNGERLQGDAKQKNQKVSAHRPDRAKTRSRSPGPSSRHVHEFLNPDPR